MPDIRNQGFGLNFNRGFGSKGTFVGGGYDPRNQDAMQGYQRRQTDQQNNAFQGGQLDKQLGFQREQSINDNALRQQGYNNQLQIAQTQADASKYPSMMQQRRFDTVFPYLSKELGGQGNSGYGYQGKGQVGDQPNISDAPVYNEQQIQQQVNSQRAGNDASAATQQRNMRQQMSARGYGGNSPLAMELGMGIQNQNLQANTDTERQLRFDAAGANSKQVLGAQTQKETQFANRQQEDIERNKVYQSRYNALLAALSGLV